MRLEDIVGASALWSQEAPAVKVVERVQICGKATTLHSAGRELDECLDDAAHASRACPVPEEVGAEGMLAKADP